MYRDNCGHQERSTADTFHTCVDIFPGLPQSSGLVDVWSAQNLHIHPQKMKCTSCVPQHTLGHSQRANVDGIISAWICNQLTESMKNGLTSSQTGFILLSIPAFISPSPIPFPNQASRGFLYSPCIAALTCPPILPCLHPSIHFVIHSLQLPPPLPPTSGTDSCHCKHCSHSVLGCSVRMGSLLHCCSVYMTMCVHVRGSRRVSSLTCPVVRTPYAHRHRNTEIKSDLVI